MQIDLRGLLENVEVFQEETNDYRFNVCLHISTSLRVLQIVQPTDLKMNTKCVFNKTCLNCSTENITANTHGQWEEVVVGMALILVILLTVVGNALVLLAIKQDKRLQTPFNCYIVNLAITDIAVATTAMSFYAIENVMGSWPFGDFLCGVWVFSDYGLTFASLFTLLAISVDRFWSVTWSLHYRHHHSRKKCLIIIAVIW